MFDYSKLYGRIKEVYGSQEAFADAMGISRTNVSELLNGKVHWKPDKVAKACDLLGIPLTEAHLFFYTLKVVESRPEE